MSTLATIAHANPRMGQPRRASDSPGTRLLAACAVAVLVAALVASRAAPFLTVAPQATHTTPASVHATGATAGPGQAAAGIDVGSTVERLQHRVTAVPARPGALVASDRTYAAAFDSAGFSVAPPAAATGFGINLSAVGRTGHRAAVTPRHWTGDANVASRAVSAGFVERVTAATGAVEWDLVVQHRPSGTGALRVEADVNGTRGAAVRSALGGHPTLRFTLTSGAHVHVGELVVKDATGAELYRTLPSVHGGHLRLDVPARILATARYPLTVDPTVSPESAAGTIAAPTDQHNPAIAWNGTNFLLVWSDARDGQTNIYGTRLAASGAVLDPAGIPISTATGFQDEPDVAWNGTNFLVVWEDSRSGTENIDAARVTKAGSVLDPAGIPMSIPGSSQLHPSVASDGTNFLVVWDDDRNSTPQLGDEDIYGTRVDGSGTVLDGDGFAVSIAADYQLGPDVAWNGTNYLVVWQDIRSEVDYDVYAARVDPLGEVLDPSGFAVSAVSGGQGSPSVASDGTDFLVAWYDLRNSGDGDIYASRVSGAGVTQDPSGIAVSTAANFQQHPAVTSDGTNYLIAWDDRRTVAFDPDIYAARVNASGTVLDAGGIPIATATNQQQDVAVGWNGTNFQLAWGDQRSGTFDIYGSRLSTSGTALDASSRLLSTTPDVAGQTDPALAWNGTNFLVVWSDARNGNADIYGARLDGNGGLLDTTGIAVSIATGNQVAPAVVWNGANFFVAWDDGRNGGHDIYGTRVTSSGTVLSGAGTIISTATNNQTQPALASDGTNTLAAWSDTRNGATNSDIYSTRINTAGNPLNTTGIALSNAASNQTNPALAGNGTNFLVAWGDTRNGATNSDIYSTRVNTSGTPLSATGVVLSNAASNQTSPAVAWDGTNFLVAWGDTRNGSTNSDIYSTRVNTAGNPLSATGVVLSNAAHDQTNPAVAYNGSSLVVWLDRRANRNDIYGTRVDANGAAQDAGGIAVEATALDSGNPAVSPGSGTRWGTAYERDQSVGETAVFLRTVAPK